MFQSVEIPEERPIPRPVAPDGLNPRHDFLSAQGVSGGYVRFPTSKPKKRAGPDSVAL